MVSLRARAAVRKIQRLARRIGARRGLMRYRRKRQQIYRGALTTNPMPSFTETYIDTRGSAAVNAGGVFAVRITDIPQIAQYNTLYKQYRINWVKVMLLPIFNSEAIDYNSAAYNNTVGAPNVSMGRIAYAINDSPQLVPPANETDVLTDNGCKVKPLRSKWSCSFKPVPDVAAIGGTTGNPIYTRQKFRQWFNFDTQLAGNNPLHYGISYYITQNVSPGAVAYYNVFYKVNFSLRDPQ